MLGLGPSVTNNSLWADLRAEPPKVQNVQDMTQPRNQLGRHRLTAR